MSHDTTRSRFKTLADLILKYLIWDGWVPWLTAPDGYIENPDAVYRCVNLEPSECLRHFNTAECRFCDQFEPESDLTRYLLDHLTGVIDPIVFTPRYRSNAAHLLRIADIVPPPLRQRGKQDDSISGILRLGIVCKEVGLIPLMESDCIYLGFDPALPEPVVNTLAYGLIEATGRSAGYQVSGLDDPTSTSPFMRLPLYGCLKREPENTIRNPHDRLRITDDPIKLADQIPTHTPLEAKQAIGRLDLDIWPKQPGGPHPNITTTKMTLEAYDVWKAIQALVKHYAGGQGTFKRNGNWVIHFSYNQLTMRTGLTMNKVIQAVRELIALGFIRKVPYWEAKERGGDIPDFHGGGLKKRAPFYEICGPEGIGPDPLVKTQALQPIRGKLKEADACHLAEALNDTDEYIKRARALKP